MATQTWLYDAILYIYALSLLFFFSDFMNASLRAKRIGAGLLIFVWVLQTGYLIWRIASHLQMTAVTPFEYWLGFTWLLITISLVISRFIKIDFVVFFVNVIGFAVLALNLYSNQGGGESLAVWRTTRELLYIHISLVLCAYAALTIGALFAGMYLFLHNQLKRKRWTSFVRRLPSLELIERYGDRAVIIGVPLLAMSLAIAVTSVLVEGRASLLFDWKVVTSCATLTMYVIYVYQRARLKRPGQQLARLYMLAFGTLILNLLANSISSFH
ncbi:cytochrome c biogenesis protein CcsA [Paenibacillus arenilitoris]|uniref:Cytochrome c biogenesis protein CcsA n=1 Tax=Paenibacillus arenilitoris TaxID=2772299 RepID=A0A927H8C0_9BACL|nr:cytochrome c biogenesis protein CcsA [Paenibacillus arenilitoris]MBD2870469.1 cytochrome c biogenesis protein CcsA [Paenibacillus arenilitoris]